ncbi:MAG: alpha/beta hydrolase [Planctomycetota bacterium]
MSSPSILWKSVEGRERLASWFETFLAKADFPVERVAVETSAGVGNVLIAGKEDAPPLVCLHGMRTGSAFLLSEVTRLGSRFRLYVPDLPGQSVIGPDVRLALDGDAYAVWLKEVLDGLGLAAVHLFGVSWGGYVARLTASAFPERVSTLALLCPAGVANGSHLTGLARMALPLLRYKLRPTENSLRSLLAPIMTTWDHDWANAFACSLNDLKMDTRVPPLASDDELRQLIPPTLVIAGEDDISFPGAAVIDRAERLVPHTETELVAGCKHCPPTTNAFRVWLSDRVTDFIHRSESSSR